MRTSTSSTRRSRGEGAGQYPLAADAVRQAGRVSMPRLPRLHAPGATVHVVGRCNNGEFCFTTPDDFKILLTRLEEMTRNYGVTLYAYTLMTNHVHLLLQAPLTERLARPLRWFFREITRAWQGTRGRRGHFWERRYWSCLVDDDAYVLAALRYCDRNPVRAGLVEDPASYPWSSCSAYALGAPNPLVQFHPSYLVLSSYPKVRQRHYRRLLEPSVDPRADARDPRWTTERVVGGQAFMARHGLRCRTRRRSGVGDQANQ
jgi:putative transposase